MMQIKEEEFETLLGGLVLLEISGSSCASCVALRPVLHTVAKRLDLKFVSLDIEQIPTSWLERWQISRVPTAMLMEDGKDFARFSGFQPEEIAEMWIESKMEERNKQKNNVEE
jgi:thioredoxin-like negative regulator of GroEL